MHQTEHLRPQNPFEVNSALESPGHALELKSLHKEHPISWQYDVPFECLEPDLELIQIPFARPPNNHQ